MVHRWVFFFDPQTNHPSGKSHKNKPQDPQRNPSKNKGNNTKNQRKTKKNQRKPKTGKNGENPANLVPEVQLCVKALCKGLGECNVVLPGSGGCCQCFVCSDYHMKCTKLYLILSDNLSIWNHLCKVDQKKLSKGCSMTISNHCSFTFLYPLFFKLLQSLHL